MCMQRVLLHIEVYGGTVDAPWISMATLLLLCTNETCNTTGSISHWALSTISIFVCYSVHLF